MSDEKNWFLLKPSRPDSDFQFVIAHARGEKRRQYLARVAAGTAAGPFAKWELLELDPESLPWLAGAKSGRR